MDDQGTRRTSARSRSRATSVARVAGLALATFFLGGVVVLRGSIYLLRALDDTTFKPSATGTCDSADPLRSSHLGLVAYENGGSIWVSDVATGQERPIAETSGEPNVSWSPDGAWVGFGRPWYVAAGGGPRCDPFPRTAVRSWEWSPAESLIVAITAEGGLLVGGPGRTPTHLLEDGWGARSFAFDGPGERLAIGRLVVTGQDASVRFDRQEIWVLDLPSHALRRVYTTPAGIAPPQVARWSPDGEWILFWPVAENSSSLAADGAPLMAVPADGGRPRTIGGSLLYRDFLAWCGDELIVAAGGGRDVTVGKRLIAASAPGWRARPVSRRKDLSWLWPACHGGRIATALGPAAGESTPGTEPRTIWILSRQGNILWKLDDRFSSEYAAEAPRWSGDGQTLMFVKRRLGSPARAEVFYWRFDTQEPAGWKVAEGPVADFGNTSSYYGHGPWNGLFDWFDPTS